MGYAAEHVKRRLIEVQTLGSNYVVFTPAEGESGTLRRYVLNSGAG